jgi:hypothetical protein
MIGNLDEDLPEILVQKISESEDAVRNLFVEGYDGFIHSYEDETLTKLPIPRSLLWKLSRDKDSKVRASVAYHVKDLPEDLIRELVWSGESDVRAAIAGRKDVPLDMLKFLAKDGEKVRVAVAKREDLPEEVLLMLTDDESWQVRRFLERRKEKRISYRYGI